MRIIKEYFSFTRKERNGILVLTFIILVLFGFWKTAPYFRAETKPDFSDFEDDIKVFEASLQDVPEKVYYKGGKTNTDNRAPYSLFNFDPNIAGKEELISLGIPEKTAERICKYRDKGGRFKTREDLKKIYGISEEIYLRLENNILIANNNTTEKKQTTGKEPGSEPVPVSSEIIIKDLNIATAEELMKVRGIGEVMSSRIIRYRELLGGYVRKEQLLEVYGMSNDNYLKIQEQLLISEESVRKLNINLSEVEDLAKHPYIDYRLARKIFNSRIAAGKIYDIEYLLKKSIVDSAEFEKIRCYISVN